MAAGLGGFSRWPNLRETILSAARQLSDSRSTRPRKSSLHGHLRLTYENRSPDTLPGLYIHLWPNAYKNRHTPYAIQQRRNGKSTFHFAQAAQRGYMDSLSFSVSGVATQPLPVTKGPRPAPGYSQYLLKKAIDVVWLPFPEPLPPGGKVVIETPFRVKIPNTFSRLGHAGAAVSNHAVVSPSRRCMTGRGGIRCPI
jgi:hypothetical protein